ncbi:MAG: hypothetical protein JXR70_14755, partial [Spirochaetales bacterium]|nr:hypothetical protein [Spirochaetales bacterium]
QAETRSRDYSRRGFWSEAELRKARPAMPLGGRQRPESSISEGNNHQKAQQNDDLCEALSFDALK